jgi:acyl-coenzyme A synthetase/AMP-(fatty) acid ligase
MLSKLYPEVANPLNILAEDDLGRVLRYDDLGGLSSVWKERLPGRQLVFLLCANTVPHISAYAGLNGAGHVIVLLSKTIARSTLQKLIKLYNPNAIVYSNNADEMDVEILSQSVVELHPDLSICLSTSGSTGSPKFVRYSERALIANAESIRGYLQIGLNEVAMAHLPFEYSFGLSILHSHVASGAKLLLSEHSIMQKPFWGRIRNATSIAGVPYHFEMMLRLHIENSDLPELRTLTQAGGHMSPQLVKQLHDIAERREWKFHVMYGQTEAGPRISWLPHELVSSYPQSIGHSIPGVSMFINDGELTVRSPAIMMGYANCRDDLARGDDLGGLISTGDLAEEVGPGIFSIIGRKSRFIKILGNRVSLQDIESSLLDKGHTVYCVGEDDNLQVFTTNSDTDALRRAATELFSFPIRAFKIQFLREIPRYLNGKVNYSELSIIAKEFTK